MWSTPLLPCRVSSLKQLTHYFAACVCRCRAYFNNSCQDLFPATAPCSYLSSFFFVTLPPRSHCGPDDPHPHWLLQQFLSQCLFPVTAPFFCYFAPTQPLWPWWSPSSLIGPEGETSPPSSCFYPSATHVSPTILRWIVHVRGVLYMLEEVLSCSFFSATLVSPTLHKPKKHSPLR
jgi:hypothetical protein